MSTKFQRFGNKKFVDIWKELKYEFSRLPDFPKKVLIGTDSIISGKVSKFATVVVIHHEGRGAVGYYTRWKTEDPQYIKSLHTRMWKETMLSVEIGKELIEFIIDLNVEEIEIHADLNTAIRHRSSEVLQACLGYIRANGFTGKSKPDAVAASKVADRVVRR